jgi:polar amino acid transport system substrate-binding protein
MIPVSFRAKSRNLHFALVALSAAKGLLFCCCALTLTACNLPRDAEGTLDHVRNRAVRVGVTENPPWTHMQDHQPSGIEVTLVNELAQRLNTKLEWIEGNETALLKSLKERHLDLVIGGFEVGSPWQMEVAFTRPYEGGKKARHVFVVPPGENAWMLEVERFLLERGPVVFAHRGN